MSNYSLGQIIANPFTYDNVTGKILIGISGPPTGVQSVDNEGNGHELVDNTDPANPKIKSIITGEGITMVNNGDDETISTNINYSAEDTNGKLNIFGLTSDFVSNTRLLVGQGTDTLDFQDDFGNKININEDKILIEQTNTSTDNTLARIAIANLPDKINNPTFLDSVIEFKNNILEIATQDVNSNQNQLILEGSGITLLTNESVLIQPDVNFTTRVNDNPGVFTRTIQDGANISKEVVSISDNNTIMTMNYDTIFSASTSTGRSVETSLLNSPGDSYFRAKTVNQASPTLDRGELNVDLNGGYLYSFINNDINGVQVNGSQINITGDQINLIGLPNIPGYADTLVYNQITGQVAYKPVTTVDSLTLIGNPVHAFVNTTGNLDYRGMISPDGSVNFNVTPTNIEMEVTNPNNTLINYQLADLNLGTGNIITKIGDENQDSSIDFQPGGNVILNIGGVGDLNVQTGGGDAIHDIAGRITLKSGIGDVRSPNLSTATSANILYYNTANGRITYGTVNSVVNGPIDVNITANTIPINSLTDTLLQSVTVPSNTFTGILGQSIRINASGRIDISAVGNAEVKTSIDGVVIASLTRSGAVPIPTINDYTINGYFTITSYSAPNATFKYSIVTQFNNGSNDSSISTGTTSSIAINTSFDIETFGQTGATATITQDILKIWKE